MPKRNFSFISNALSKGGYLKGLLQALTFSGKKNHQKTFELLARYFQVPKQNIFLFGAGRMSVYALLKSLHVKENDEVIVAGYTCVVLTNAVKFAGCKVRYVDISPESLNLNTEKLLSAINTNTKAVIVPHNFGLTYNDINVLKKQHPNLIIIEDVAHSFGSLDGNGKRCGTLGDASFFSLEYSKPITAGLGGIMLVNNDTLLVGVQEQYDQAPVMSKGMAIKILLTLGTLNLYFFQSTTLFQRFHMKVLRALRLNYKTSDKEISGELPENYPVKMNPILSNVLIQQLNKIEAINNSKSDIVRKYQTAFSEFSSLHQYDTENQILVRYPILFKKEVSIETVEKIKSDALANGIRFGDWFNDVIHPKGSYRYCYNSGDCPKGEWVAARMINLPVNVHQQVPTETLDLIISIFRQNGIS